MASPRGPESKIWDRPVTFGAALNRNIREQQERRTDYGVGREKFSEQRVKDFWWGPIGDVANR
jgi:hypothetical protein